MPIGMRGVFTRFHSRFHSKAGIGAEPWGIAPNAPGRTSHAGFPWDRFQPVTFPLCPLLPGRYSFRSSRMVLCG